MLRTEYFYSADLEKATKMEVGAHGVGAFGSPRWKKLKENRVYHLRPPEDRQQNKKWLHWAP